MVFSSTLFVFFLPITVFLYFIAKNKYQNYILLIASLIFYACGEPQAVFLMLLSITINYFLAILIAKRQNTTAAARTLLIIDIAFNLSLLGYFKYTSWGIGIINRLFQCSFQAPDVALPIGISFFTFQAMSYVIDVYRKEVTAEKSIFNVGLYISFFPQLVAGPIVRYKTISEQIHSRSITLSSFGKGVKRFLLGFIKKIILANHLAVVVNATMGQASSVSGYVQEMPVLLAWLASICYTLQIFFDFSAYSDMAIGLGKMFGFDFEENFNYPYISKTVTEFWRRWHISLSRWFRDYVYIPLGGSRVSVPRCIFNLFIVWLLTGLWHGAASSFILWGFIYFIFLIFEKYILNPDNKNIILRFIWRLITLLIVNVSWILFYMESTGEAGRYMKAMLGLYGNDIMNIDVIYYLREYGIYMALGILFSMPIAPWIKRRLAIHPAGNILSIYIIPAAYMILFLWSVSFLIMGAHNPFIYFNF